MRDCGVPPKVVMLVSCSGCHGLCILVVMQINGRYVIEVVCTSVSSSNSLRDEAKSASFLQLVVNIVVKKYSSILHDLFSF